MDARPGTAASPADSDAALVDWVRHYAVLVIALVVLGALGGATWGALTTPRAEMWSIVVDTQQLLPARQLGVVAETVFRAEETYRAALAGLRSELTPDELFDMVELRSVPESRLLIVVAKGDDTYSASIVSDAMARSLADAFAEAGYPGFEILGAPQPPTVSSTVSLPVFAGLGGSVGLLVGVAIAIVHFRTRRPVLSLGAANAAIGPDDVISIPQRWRSLGVLRHLVPVTIAPPARDLAIRQLRPQETTVALRWAGVRPGRAARLAALLDLDVDPEAERAVLVADAGTGMRDLRDESTLRADQRRTLLWLA